MRTAPDTVRNIHSEALAHWLSVLLPAGRPRRVAQMYAKGPDKYRDFSKARPFTPAMLAAHAAGRATYAITLDSNERARVGAIDVDTGRAGLLAALDAARAAGVIAFALAYETDGGHAGGHLWCLYADWHHPAQIATQLHQIACAAGLPTAECWPSNQVIRLPFGYHQRARTFGTLITQDGETFALDDPAQRDAAVQLVQALPLNAAPPALPAPVVRSVPVTERTYERVSPGEAGAERMSARDAIAQFNRDHSIEFLLLQYGGERTADGWACNCGVAHTHQTQLQVLSRGTIVSYSPRCRWAPLYNSGRATDAFELYCIVEHEGNRKAALDYLNPPVAPRQKRQNAPHTAESIEYTLTPDEQARRAADAQRKRDARRAEAAAIRTNVEARASQDDTLSTDALLVLMALLDIAGTRAWCRPSIARIATMIPMCERRVHYALRELEAHQYITSSARTGGTTIRTFVAGALDVSMSALEMATSVPNADEYINKLVIQKESACEGGPAAPAPATAPDVCSTPKATPEPAPAAHACPPLTSFSSDVERGQRFSISPTEDGAAGAWYDPTPCDEAAPLAEHEKPAWLRSAGSLSPFGARTELHNDTDEPHSDQETLDAAPVAPTAPAGQHHTPHAAYARKVAAMNTAELAAESIKLRNCAKSPKHAGARWVTEHQRIVGHEQTRRAAQSTATRDATPGIGPSRSGPRSQAKRTRTTPPDHILARPDTLPLFAGLTT